MLSWWSSTICLCVFTVIPLFVETTGAVSGKDGPSSMNFSYKLVPVLVYKSFGLIFPDYGPDLYTNVVRVRSTGEPGDGNPD